jgi:ATP-dependent Clp protease ATP-binding subunit ClpA
MKKRKWRKKMMIVVTMMTTTMMMMVVMMMMMMMMMMMTMTLPGRQADRLLHMEQKLSERVVGQDGAIAIIANAVRLARAGLRPHDRPTGVFLFLGPTGWVAGDDEDEEEEEKEEDDDGDVVKGGDGGG